MHVFRLLFLGLLVPVSLPAATSPLAFNASAVARVRTDSNLFLQKEAPLASGQTQPALPADAGDFIADFGLSLGLIWKAGPLLTLDASYAPELFCYHRFAAENHTDHRLSLNATGHTDGWSYETKNSLLHVDGSQDSLIFNRLGGAPCVGGEPVRSHRAQDILRATGRVTRTGSAGFVRGVISDYDQDFHTRERSTSGYANYVDRSEWSAGVEAGWNAGRGVALVAGVRQGRQRQANLLGTMLNYTNTFTRWLAGVEGSLGSTLKFSLLAGPDLRRFGPAVRPEFNRHQTTSYGEYAMTWTPDKADNVAFSGKRYLWLSAGGRGVYVESLYDLAWTRRLPGEWSFTAGANYHTGNTGRFNPASPRHDLIYAGRLAFTRSFGSATSVELSLLHDWGDSLVPNTPGREYTRWLTSLGVTHRW